MELTQPAILTLIDYLYTGCIQASSYITVNTFYMHYEMFMRVQSDKEDLIFNIVPVIDEMQKSPIERR